MPLFNGERTIRRAVYSVLAQEWLRWELLIIDDCSTDTGRAVAEDFSKTDPRIRVLSTPSNSGPSLARNLAIVQAHYPFISYLDCDDEYYPYYLARLAALVDKADVYVSAYDVFADGEMPEPLYTWCPHLCRSEMFSRNVSVPLGVAHRKAAIIESGGFDDTLWNSEDWNCWRAMARRGASFLFLPMRCGRYYVREGSHSGNPVVTGRQKELIAENLSSDRSPYAARLSDVVRRPSDTSVVYASPWRIDECDGAGSEQAMRMLKVLSSEGYDCAVFCGSARRYPRTQGGDSVAVGAASVELAVQSSSAAPAAEILPIDLGGFRGSVVSLEGSDLPPSTWEAAVPLLDGFEQSLRSRRPTMVLTPGDDPIGRELARRAKALDIPVVYVIYDLAIAASIEWNWQAIRTADYVLVFSNSSARVLWEQLRLKCHVLPLIANDPDVCVEGHDRCYATIVQTTTHETALCAGIAREIRTRRADIPVVVVKRSSDGMTASECKGPPAVANGDVNHISAFQPARYLKRSRAVIVPSVGWEAAALSVVEALASRIPVITSGGGALAEIVSDGGLLIEYGAKNKADAQTDIDGLSTEPWVEAIIRLWDDPELFASLGNNAARRAELWNDGRVRRMYEKFFSSVCLQSYPPMVPPSVPPGE